MDVRRASAAAPQSPTPQTQGLKAALQELRAAKFFEVSQLAGGSNWLRWPVGLIASLDAQTERLLATKGIQNVGDLALSKAAWPLEGFSPAGTAAITTAQKTIRAMAEKHGFSLTAE